MTARVHNCAVDDLLNEATEMLDLAYTEDDEWCVIYDPNERRFVDALLSVHKTACHAIVALDDEIGETINTELAEINLQSAEATNAGESVSAALVETAERLRAFAVRWRAGVHEAMQCANSGG